jgi:hypothetical protein
MISALNKELLYLVNYTGLIHSKEGLLKPHIFHLFTEFGNNRRGGVKVRSGPVARMRGFRKWSRRSQGRAREQWDAIILRGKMSLRQES